MGQLMGRARNSVPGIKLLVRAPGTVTLRKMRGSARIAGGGALCFCSHNWANPPHEADDGLIAQPCFRRYWAIT